MVVGRLAAVLAGRFAVALDERVAAALAGWLGVGASGAGSVVMAAEQTGAAALTRPFGTASVTSPPGVAGHGAWAAPSRDAPGAGAQKVLEV